MRSSAAGLIVIVLSTDVWGQVSTATEEFIEITAARAMLKHSHFDGTLGINPDFGIAGAAPAVSSGLARPMQRSTRLARALGASERRVVVVSQCRVESTCAPSGLDGYLTLSEPELLKDTATVTVTLTQGARDAVPTRAGQAAPAIIRRTFYETVRFTLVLRSRTWVIVREDQLGIS